MSKRHAGWFIHRLHNYFSKGLPSSANSLTRVNSYKAVAGHEKSLMRLIIQLGQYNSKNSYRSELRGNTLFTTDANFFVAPTLPESANALLIKNLYLLKLIASRSYRALRMSKRRPVHGQRRWGNAKMAKKCNTFIYNSAKAYELDLFNYRQRRKFKWSYAWEMRQKAKMKKKVTKKKWTKFRKFGERRLAVKKKKKSPWD